MNIPHNLLPLLEQFPTNLQEKIIEWWSTKRDIISFRVNHLKSSEEEVISALEEAKLPYKRYIFPTQNLPSCPTLSRENEWDIFYLPLSPSPQEGGSRWGVEYEYILRGLEIYTSGKIYVQSLSSMIPVLCLDLQAWQKILDMTAAPGGKTTQIASILKWKCEIIALEKFGIRYEKLLHTIRLQSAEVCTRIIKHDAIETEKLSVAADWQTDPHQFDRILLDAPCSSDGRINLEEEKTYRWYDNEKSERKSELQKNMLHTAASLLAPDGKIVYSTCSLSRTENEKVIRAFLRTHPDFTTSPLPFSSDFSLPEYDNIICGRWLPGAMMEGFFVCVLWRNLWKES